MADITKCANKNCSVKYKCYRFTALDDSHWQSYADFNSSKPITDASQCEHFIRDRRTTSKSKKGSRK